MKYLVAPSQMPDELTGSNGKPTPLAVRLRADGGGLLSRGRFVLVDKSILDLTPLRAGLFSFCSLALAWLLYESACRSGLAQRELPFAIGGYLFPGSR